MSFRSKSPSANSFTRYPSNSSNRSFSNSSRSPSRSPFKNHDNYRDNNFNSKIKFNRYKSPSDRKRFSTPSGSSINNKNV